jgi:hypothetical protein
MTKTYFDSPERSTIEEINQRSAKIKQTELILNILEGFPDLAVILDKNRQIVAANKKAVRTFRKSSFEEIKGKRVGEALKCIHRNDVLEEESCGITKFCSLCGAGKSIKYTNDNFMTPEEECRIVSELNDGNEAFDFRVITTPLVIDGEQYALFAIRDISDEKRREALERIFFHDVLNTASVINNAALLLQEADDEEYEEFLKLIIDSSNQLISEIKFQRDLRNAEEGNLSVNLTEVSVNEILDLVASFYENHPVAEGKEIKIEFMHEDIKLKTDQSMLVRSMGNLLKNALEASKEGEDVIISATADEEHVRFSVHNTAVIPGDVQMQIFQRSFSTKGGPGRGLGTYSAKLFIEKYLNGEVYFISNEKEGTVFNIKLRRKI